MIKAAFKALGDLLSPAFRAILGRAIAMTLGLFIAFFAAVEYLIGKLTLLPWPWADTLLQVGTGLALLVAFFFLMSPVMAIFAGLFLDDVAARVEATHYPSDLPGQPLPGHKAIVTALQFASVALVVNLAVLPLVFTGIGALALIVANAYLVSREFFELAAMRHMDGEDARALRKANSPYVFAAGFVPALISMVPIVNLVVPLFATSYFVHIFKGVRLTSP